MIEGSLELRTLTILICRWLSDCRESVLKRGCRFDRAHDGKQDAAHVTHDANGALLSVICDQLPVLSLAGVTKSFGDHVALDDVSLSIERGETVVLIGPSGCGKSTLLRTLNGLILPDRGVVRFDGEAVSADTSELMCRRMGYVIQDGGLFPHLTAYENVALMARYLGRDASEVRDRVRSLAELTRLDEQMLGRYPVEMSGGQRQRVSLMRALMLDPEVLLLDEPLGALDPLIRADLQGDLKNIFDSLGKTLVLVTHDMSEAIFFADRIVLMRDGRIVQADGPAELLHKPAEPFVTQFIQAQRRAVDTMRGLET